MPKPVEIITPTTVFCPRCDRGYDDPVKKTLPASLEVLAEHVDEAHPDMDNWIKEELEDERGGIS